VSGLQALACSPDTSSRIKDQLDVTCYFISLLSVRVAGWSLLQPATRTLPKHSRTKSPTHHGHYPNPAAPILQHTTDTTQIQPHQISNTPQTLPKPSRTKSPTHHGHYPNTAAPNLQHTTDTTQTQPHQISNTQPTENKTTDVVIQQQSRKLLMMDILMPETC